MTADEERRMHELFTKGDPAVNVSPQLPARVSARLDARVVRGPRLSRAVLVSAALISSAGLGAAATWVTRADEAEVSETKAPVARVAPKPVAPVAVVEADPTAVEAELLQSALESLQQNDAAAALRTLDERARRFPEGLLQSEARVATVRALFATGRDSEALATLQQFDGSELTVSLRLAWADALVRQGDCAQAMAVASEVTAPSVEQGRVLQSLQSRCAVKGISRSKP